MSNNVMTKHGIKDPTAYIAIKNATIQDAIKHGKKYELTVDEKHHEWTIRCEDGKGHVTYTSGTYTTSEEIPAIW